MSVSNVTLPTFATERQQWQHGACSAPTAINQYLLSAKCSVATSQPLLLLLINEQNYTDSAPHTMWAASINGYHYLSIIICCITRDNDRSRAAEFHNVLHNSVKV